MLNKTISLSISVLLFLSLARISFSQADSNLDSMLARLNSTDVKGKIYSYVEILQHYNRTMPDNSIMYGEKALQLTLTGGYKLEEAEILYLVGVAYQAKSNYAKAMEYYQSSSELSKKINNKAGVGKCLNRISQLNDVHGEYEKAMENCLKALSILENSNDKRALGSTYNTLAILHYILKDSDKAMENARRALQFNEALNDEILMAVSHEHLGIIYIGKKDYKSALFHIKKSLELNQAKNDKFGIAGSYGNLAVIYRSTGKYEEALKYYNASLAIKKEMKNLRGIASSTSSIGLTYYNMGQYEKSLKYMHQALALRKKLGDKRGIAVSFSRLSDVYSAMNDYKSSLEYFKKSKSLNDSLINEGKNKRIAEYQAAYNNEKQQKEILMLQQENTIQGHLQIFLLAISLLLAAVAISIAIAYRSKRKINALLVEHSNEITEQKEELLKLNGQLKEAIVTKDKFFSIIAHDLKTPYQGLLGYSQILSAEYTTLTEKEKLTFIKSIEELSQNSFKLLENLLEWSRLQTGKIVFDPENLNLLLELFPTLGLLKQTAQNKQIILDYEIGNSIFVYADKNMLSMIIRNLVSNSIKFTNPAGSISIRVKTDDEFVEVSIADTGVGMTKNVLDNLFNLDKSISTKGTANEEGTGLGLSLCKEMITRNGGKIWAESEVGNGTTFFFTLRKK